MDDLRIKIGDSEENGATTVARSPLRAHNSVTEIPRRLPSRDSRRAPGTRVAAIKARRLSGRRGQARAVVAVRRRGAARLRRPPDTGASRRVTRARRRGRVSAISAISAADRAARLGKARRPEEARRRNSRRYRRWPPSLPLATLASLPEGFSGFAQKAR